MLALGHTLLAWNNLKRGMARVDANEEKIKAGVERALGGCQRRRTDDPARGRSQRRVRVAQSPDARTRVKREQLPELGRVARHR